MLFEHSIRRMADTFKVFKGGIFALCSQLAILDIDSVSLSSDILCWCLREQLLISWNDPSLVATWATWPAKKEIVCCILWRFSAAHKLDPRALFSSAFSYAIECKLTARWTKLLEWHSNRLSVANTHTHTYTQTHKWSRLCHHWAARSLLSWLRSKQHSSQYLYIHIILLHRTLSPSTSVPISNRPEP